MNALAWVLVAWLVLALLGGAFATWFGWHLRRFRHERYLGRRDPLDCSESSGRDTPAD